MDTVLNRVLLDRIPPSDHKQPSECYSRGVRSHLGGAARCEILQPSCGGHGLADGGAWVEARGGEEAGGAQAHGRGRLQHVLVRRPQR